MTTSTQTKAHITPPDLEHPDPATHSDNAMAPDDLCALHLLQHSRLSCPQP